MSNDRPSAPTHHVEMRYRALVTIAFAFAAVALVVVFIAAMGCQGPQGTDAAQTQSGQIEVRVLVSSPDAGGSVSVDENVTLVQGSTAYDALVATGLSVNAKNTQYGVYVSAIDSLAESQHGTASGWLYKIGRAHV